MARPCIAQDNNKASILHPGYVNSGLHVGVRVQPQMALMINKDDRDNNSYKSLNKFGFGFGIAAGYNFNNHTGIELNILYSLQGKRYKMENVEFNQQLHYVKIPVMYTYATKPARFIFIGKIGPQLGITTYAHIDPAVVNGTSITDNKAQYENVVMSGVVSAGARYALTESMWLDASLKYDMSFTNVENSSYEHFPAGRSETYNVIPGIEVGFSYHIH